jgi:glycerophosphoryl diester phosphodiesterase
VRRIVDALREVRHQCVIVASDLTALHFTRLNFGLPIGWVLADYSGRSALKAESVAPDYLLCDHQLLPPEGGRLWRGPWCWVIYDVATRQLALKYAARGASLIETTSIRTMLREFRGLQVALLARGSNSPDKGLIR